MSQSDNLLACLECGGPLPEGGSWLCLPRCAAVFTLVRYGRSHVEEGPDPVDPDGLDVDADLLNRYRRRAGIIGRFPSLSVRRAVLGRDRGRCACPNCPERGITRTDWRSNDPVVTKRVRVGDLRTLCARHHREVSLQRFVGEGGRTARTGPAVWARMVSVEPLVLRDDASLWEAPAKMRFLSAWPLASGETRGDLVDWFAVLAQMASEPLSLGPAGDAGFDDTVARLNGALDRLALSTRRSERLVRAIHGLLLGVRASEIMRDALKLAMDETHD